MSDLHQMKGRKLDPLPPDAHPYVQVLREECQRLGWGLTELAGALQRGVTTAHRILSAKTNLDVPGLVLLEKAGVRRLRLVIEDEKGLAPADRKKLEKVGFSKKHLDYLARDAEAFLLVRALLEKLEAGGADGKNEIMKVMFRYLK